MKVLPYFCYKLCDKHQFIKDLRRSIFNTEDHPAVASSLENVAHDYSNLGQNSKALEQLNKSLGSFIRDYKSKKYGKKKFKWELILCLKDNK